MLLIGCQSSSADSENKVLQVNNNFTLNQAINVKHIQSVTIIQIPSSISTSYPVRLNVADVEQYELNSSGCRYVTSEPSKIYSLFQIFQKAPIFYDDQSPRVYSHKQVLYFDMQDGSRQTLKLQAINRSEKPVLGMFNNRVIVTDNQLLREMLNWSFDNGIFFEQKTMQDVVNSKNRCGDYFFKQDRYPTIKNKQGEAK